MVVHPSQGCQGTTVISHQLTVISHHWARRAMARLYQSSVNSSLPITHYPLPITYYPLPITHYLLPITYYPLPIT